MDSLDSLRHLIQHHPLIDNHAHNLLSCDVAADYDSYPLESITSEAHGRALENARTALPLVRAVNQLGELYGTPCANWDDVLAAHTRWVQEDYEGLVRRSLEGTHILLLDDLLSDEDVELYDWHDQFTSSPTKRIVRIEAVAASLLRDIMGEERKTGDSVWTTFRAKFIDALERSMDDPAVVGFKSVICYRTGLDVDPYSPDEDLLTASLHRTLDSGTRKSGYRVQEKPLNDWLVQQTLKLITFRKRAGVVKPLQFHTGLGDNDINLVKANPAYLQPLIIQYPDAPIVLLHSSYPYTRDAGYLACVYPNIYLDLGEVFPMVSREAEEKILRESLEITPVNRLLWSTDGHVHPETFWLANKQFRQSLETVLVDYVQHGDYNISQAKAAAADILFHNSNKLYGLKQTAQYTHSIRVSQTTDPLDAFLQTNPDVEYIWMQWIDYTATTRVRIFPIQEFIRIARKERRIGISLAVQWMLQDDTVTPEGSTTGQIYLKTDLSSLYLNGAMAAPAAPSATVMTFWESEEGIPLGGCPRTTLQNIVEKLHTKHDLDILCGFEIEVVFLKPLTSQHTGEFTGYAPATRNHSWSQMTADTRKMVPLLEEINRTLTSMGIHLQQFHAESASGQFEFILPPAKPLPAIDTLIAARQVITAVAERHGLRATLHPRPFADGAGSAAHAHISITPPTREDAFLAGIMKHYTSIMAFTMSQESSYERVRSGIWSGSEWVAWGFQNREAPVRKIGPGHWEFKSIDGLANPYLAVAALLGGGLIGLEKNLPLTVKECTVDASHLTHAERTALGITTPLPQSLDQSMAALSKNQELQSVLSREIVQNYLSVKRAESERLQKMADEERRLWLLERY
ncbi:Protein fluG [Penicillium brasilianum]|uniref:Protein fluG n=1 Tax=Penicillium brasilianum TaxID=104259 RepID=A0A1S9RIA0_PENBI|nr:Protein fluG [Penicillium brasilianum]